MPRFPKPFFKKSHQSWYDQLDGRQVRLGPDRDAAHRRYHELMAAGPVAGPPPLRSGSPRLVEIFDHFLAFCRDQRAPDTYEWYRWRLQMFVDEIASGLTVASLKPFHLDEWFAKHPDWASGTKGPSKYYIQLHSRACPDSAVAPGVKLEAVFGRPQRTGCAGRSSVP